MNRPPSPLSMLLSRRTKRREFITLLGGAAAAWPIAARAQQSYPRIGALSVNSSQSDGKAMARFVDGLRGLGYVQGQTVDIDFRYADGDPARLTSLAQELIALKPDVAFVNSISPALAVKDKAPNLPRLCGNGKRLVSDPCSELCAARRERDWGRLRRRELICKAR